MNSREHALLARQLVTLSGGLDESARACRVSRSRLASFGDHTAAAFMPADVINSLEQYCGEPIYSRALVDDRPAEDDAGDLLEEACETAEEAGILQRLVRQCARAGNLTEREKRDVVRDALKLRGLVDRMLAAVDAEARDDARGGTS